MVCSPPRRSCVFSNRFNGVLYLRWRTDMTGTGHGWTLVYEPDSPELSLGVGTPMAQASSGFRVVPVWHDQVCTVSGSCSSETSGSPWGPTADGTLNPNGLATEASVYGDAYGCVCVKKGQMVKIFFLLEILLEIRLSGGGVEGGVEVEVCGGSM